MISEFNEKIMMICMKHNCSVTSGYRTEKRNRMVGGHPDSQHLLGLAADIVPDDWDSADDIVFDCHRMGLIAIVEKTHVHIQALIRSTP